MSKLKVGDIVRHEVCTCRAVGVVGQITEVELADNPDGSEIRVRVLGKTCRPGTVSIFVKGTRKLGNEEAALWLLTEGWK